ASGGHAILGYAPKHRGRELAQGADLRLTPPRPGKAGPRPAAAAPPPPPRPHDPRLPPPGAALTRVYKGRALPVTVLPPGFACDGLALPRPPLLRLSPILPRRLSELALEYRAHVFGMLEARLEGDLLERAHRLGQELFDAVELHADDLGF